MWIVAVREKLLLLLSTAEEVRCCFPPSSSPQEGVRSPGLLPALELHDILLHRERDSVASWFQLTSHQ
jgi:hypothetical protein